MRRSLHPRWCCWRSSASLVGTELAGRPYWRRAARWGWSLLLAWSVAFNLFARYELYAETHSNLGNAYLQNGQLDEAITQLQKALDIQPVQAITCNTLGSALFSKGQLDEAIAQFQKALKIQPDLPEAHNNLG